MMTKTTSLPRFVRIETVYMARLNNVMHMQLHDQFYQVISAKDKGKLHLTEKALKDYRACIDVEVEQNKTVMASVHTARLAELDTKRDRLLSHFFTILRGHRLSPEPSVSQAADHVYTLLRAYTGIQVESFEAETGHIKGMLEDAKKCTAELTTLGLAANLTQLRQVMEEFDRLDLQRSQDTSVERSKLPSASAARPQTDEEFAYVSQCIQAAYIDAAADDDRQLVFDLVNHLNQISAQYKASHNASAAQKKKSKHPGDGGGKKPGGNPGGGNPGGGKKPDDGGKNPGGNPGGGGKTPDPGKEPGKDPEKEKELDEIEKMLTPLIPAFEKEIGDRPGSLSFAREVVGTGKDRRFKFYNSRTKVWTWATLRADGTLAPWVAAP